MLFRSIKQIIDEGTFEEIGENLETADPLNFEGYLKKAEMLKQKTKIDEAVKKMKAAEKNYEGNLEELQFGVKLWNNGDVTYHANYKGCKGGKIGIMANSAEELLQKLMSE